MSAGQQGQGSTHLPRSFDCPSQVSLGLCRVASLESGEDLSKGAQTRREDPNILTLMSPAGGAGNKEYQMGP